MSGLILLSEKVVFLLGAKYDRPKLFSSIKININTATICRNISACGFQKQNSQFLYYLYKLDHDKFSFWICAPSQMFCIKVFSVLNI